MFFGKVIQVGLNRAVGREVGYHSVTLLTVNKSIALGVDDEPADMCIPRSIMRRVIIGIFRSIAEGIPNEPRFVVGKVVQQEINVVDAFREHNRLNRGQEVVVRSQGRCD